MKKGLAQEKFQRTMPRAKRESREWTSFESQRRTAPESEVRYTTSNAKAPHAGEQANFSAPSTNKMPPGMNINNQAQTPNRPQPYSNAGATDESNSVNAAMLSKGYQRQQMKPEDEMYNDEHTELFYGTVEVDGDVGYVERNNMLDRT